MNHDPAEYGTFKIRVSALGEGSIEINGRDYSNEVRAFTLASGVHEITTLQVELRKGGEIEGHGVIAVVHPPDMEGAINVLDSLDTKKLEAAAMERLGWGNENLTEAIIAELKENFRGNQA